MEVFSVHSKLELKTANKEDNQVELHDSVQEIMIVLKLTSFEDVSADDRQFFSSAYEKITINLLCLRDSYYNLLEFTKAFESLELLQLPNSLLLSSVTLLCCSAARISSSAADISDH
ncbi:unnamed protein product [Hymenolepis diminuta]|uniref:Uncharacterized protein n=1 Tax=Hymenolepis diminuta TaxID=6216 RepID=A0A564YJF3_HYMDI|nr:unnamed protein product [Hymenolepis diminuta]